MTVHAPEARVGDILLPALAPAVWGSTCIAWPRGIARLGSAATPPLALLSAVMAVILGWWLLGQALSAVRGFGMLGVVPSIVASQVAHSSNPTRTAAPRRCGPCP